MIFKNIVLLLFAALFMFSCNDKEQQLKTWEEALDLREQKLMATEADYQQLLRLRDSLQNAKITESDSLATMKSWPAGLQQLWNSKMICTASDCSNYIIGDQRNEVWKFISDSTGLYMKVINNDKLIRVFKGSVSENKILLEYSADSTATRQQQIRIVLDNMQQKLIKGTQTITGQKNCTAQFSVELTPSTNK